MKSKRILVFGGGALQLSLIIKCRKFGCETIVIDPNQNAPGRELADHFYTISGEDFEGTCRIVDKHDINAIITAATDKPLVMMARIASKYNFPFFSERTALISTDKFLMKKAFEEGEIATSKGFLVSNVNEIKNFPVILKPVDSSGSRGVFYCSNYIDAGKLLDLSRSYSQKAIVLCEEFLQGDEYSVEALHCNNVTTVLQITEKQTTNFPYNVELSHLAPAEIETSVQTEIVNVINKIALTFNFNNCASHTEIKVFKNSVNVIETSPRLGGDKITSHLVPISTGVDMELALIKIALGELQQFEIVQKEFGGIFYFDFNGTWNGDEPYREAQIEGVKHFELNLHKGEKIPLITNSIDRYGHIVLTAQVKSELIKKKNAIFRSLSKNVIPS